MDAASSDRGESMLEAAGSRAVAIALPPALRASAIATAKSCSDKVRSPPTMVNSSEALGASMELAIRPRL